MFPPGTDGPKRLLGSHLSIALLPGVLCENRKFFHNYDKVFL